MTLTTMKTDYRFTIKCLVLQFIASMAHGSSNVVRSNITTKIPSISSNNQVSVNGTTYSSEPVTNSSRGSTRARTFPLSTVPYSRQATVPTTEQQSTPSSTVSPFAGTICRLYPKPKTGICKNFVGDRYIYPFRSGLRYLDLVEEDLSKVFSKIDTLVAVIRRSSDKYKTVQSLLTTYKMFNPNLIIPPDDVLRRVAEQIGKVTDQCLKEIQELHCRTYFPVCRMVRSPFGSWVTYKQPCQEMCRHVRNATCQNIAELLGILRSSNLISYFSCDIFQKYTPGVDQCYMMSYMIVNGTYSKGSWKTLAPLTTPGNTVDQATESTPTHSTSSSRETAASSIASRPSSTSPVSVRGTSESATKYPSSTRSTLKVTTAKDLTPSASRISTQPSSTGDPEDHDFSRSCPYYKDVLPNGYCKDFFHGKRIAQRPHFARVQDRAVTIFYTQAVPMMQTIFGTAAGDLKDIAYAQLSDCTNITAARALLENTVIPSREEGEYCLNLTKQYICETYHPVCLIDYAHNTIVSSAPCRESCEEFEEVCESSLKIMRGINTLKYLCPRLNDLNDRYFYAPRCNTFKKRNRKHMEQCQMIPIKASNLESQPTTQCYKGRGMMYNGFVQHTVSGRPCISWSDYSYMDVHVYRSMNNSQTFCRNPQGYRKKPWCFVNATSLEWEYCKIDRCGDLKKRVLEPSFWTLYGTWVLIGLGCSFLVVVILVFIVCYLHYKSKDSDVIGKSTEILPVYDTSLDVSGITKIIQKTNGAGELENGLEVVPSGKVHNMIGRDERHFDGHMHFNLSTDLKPNSADFSTDGSTETAKPFVRALSYMENTKC